MEIFLISENSWDKLVVQRTAEKLAAKLFLASRGLGGLSQGVDASLEQLFRSKKQPIIFVTIDGEIEYFAFEKLIHDRVGLYSDFVEPNRIFFLGDKEFSELPFLASSPLFGNYIKRLKEDVEDSQIEFLCRIAKSVEEKNTSSLKSFLKSGTDIQTVSLHESIQKSQAVEAVRNFLLGIQIPTRVASLMANISDELMMNGMFDAPVDELGRQIYASTPRTTALSLDDKSRVDLSVAFDGNYAGLSVRDRYGSVDKSRILKHLSREYKGKEYKIKVSVAGAGIGLATLLNSGASLLISVRDGEQTDVSVVFRKPENFRDMKRQIQVLMVQFER